MCKEDKKYYGKSLFNPLKELNDLLKESGRRRLVKVTKYLDLITREDLKQC